MAVRLIISLLCLFLLATSSVAQKSYKDSIQTFIKNYIDNHDAVAKEDKPYLHFYPVNSTYRFVAKFERVADGKWFSMETSGTIKKVFRVYGIIRFSLHDTAVKL